MLKHLVWAKIHQQRIKENAPTSQGAHGSEEMHTWPHWLHDPFPTKDKCARNLLIRWNYLNDFIAVAASTKRVFDSWKAISTLIHDWLMKTGKSVVPSEYINFA